MPARHRTRVLAAWLLPLVLLAGAFALLLALNVLSEMPTADCLATRSTRCQHNGGAPDPHGHGPLAALTSVMITALVAVGGQVAGHIGLGGLGGFAGYVAANLLLYVLA